MAAPELAPPPAIQTLGTIALLLDFDGTLVDLAESPDAIEVPDHLSDALMRKAREMDGRLAIVTGRYLGDVKGHLPDCAVVMSGSHGAEIESPDGSPVAEREAPRMPDAALAAARDFASGVEGLLLEEKALGLGFHYRECAPRAEDIRAFAGDVARDHGLFLRDGKMLIELTTVDSDKGEGVEGIMRHPPFAGATPVFVGDDLTDEDGFAAAERLGGFGVLVGDPRETAARFRLPGVPEVHQWLGLE